MKNVKPYQLLMMFLLGIIFVMPAHAQMAPGANVVTADESEQSPPEMRRERRNNNRTNGGPAPVREESSENSFDDACPEPRTALSETPDDLARIQEDITRFTLCVQRAQLLERLNELAQANIETIDTALNLTVGGDEDGNAVPGIMPPMGNQGTGSVSPPSIPSIPADLFADDTDDSAGSQQSSSVNLGGSAPLMGVSARSSANSSDWKIREITGSDGKLSAQLIDSVGTLARVSQGDTMPDDSGIVSTITNTRVDISKDDQTQTLKWVQ